MSDFRKFIQRNSRRITAVGALIFSLFLFSTLVNGGPTGSVWVVKNPIIVGEKITRTDISLAKVNLGSDAPHYFGAKDMVIGLVAAQNLATGDFISTSDLTQSVSKSDLSFLAIGVLAQDVSPSIVAGNRVDIWVIPKDATQSPALVLSKINVQEVDSKSRSLGGSVDITISVNQGEAQLVVDAESQGRLVIASNAI